MEIGRITTKKETKDDRIFYRPFFVSKSRE